MITIYKYTLTHPGRDLMLSLGAEILDVQVQHDGICLWAKVNTDEPLVERHFRIFGTGWELPSVTMKFISTVQTANGNLIWHVFETFE